MGFGVGFYTLMWIDFSIFGAVQALSVTDRMIRLQLAWAVW